MKETGFPSLFIDIMMLRPDARTLPHRRLAGASVTFTTLLRMAEVAHQLVEPLEAAQVLGLVVFGELHEQQRVGLAAHVGLHHRAEHGDVAGELDQRAVDHLDGDGTELDDVLRRLHRLAEGGEVADAERLVLRQRRQLQLDAARDRQRALRAAQQGGEVDRLAAGHERIDQIAADAARHLREGMGDVLRLAPAEREQVAEERERPRSLHCAARVPSPRLRGEG